MFKDELKVKAELQADIGSIGGLICEGEDDGSGVIVNKGRLLIYNIPTTDPQEEGQVWNDNGTLKISSGE